MPVVRADGASDVARLLRALATQVEAELPSVQAIVEFPGEEDTDPTLVDVRLFHPQRHRWNLIRLESALAHPGD